MHSQLDKIVANQLLDAAKSVLEYISHWMMELNQGNAQPPDGLSQTYGRVRRLRDYLQRSVAAYGRSVTLDLADGDRNLLVSCIVHHLSDVDREIEAGTGDPGWLQEKRRNLAQSAIALATRPVVRVPTRDVQSRLTTTVRSVTAAVAQKTVQLPGESVHGQGGSGSWSAVAPQAPPADPHATGAYAAQPSGGHPAPMPTHGGPETHYDGGFGMGGGFHPPHADVPYGEPGYPSAPTPPRSAPAPTGGPPAPSGPATPPPGSPVASSLGAAHQLEGAMLDPSRVSDPRLRAMAAMDLRAFERTMREEDYRLAMLHLSSLFEGVIVDHAIPRQREFELRGTPETWKLDQLVEKILGGLSSMDRPHLLQFTMARQLVRPAVQLHSPMVVTRSTLSKAIDFCRRVLAELGYAGSQDSGDAADQGWGAPPRGMTPAASARGATPQHGGPVAPGASPSAGWDVPNSPFS